MLTQRVGGKELLAAYRNEIDDLHGLSHTPVTARLRWIETWFECFPDYQPLAVLIIDEATGRIDAAAMLARRRAGLRASLVAAGHGSTDRVALSARHPEAVDRLADAIAQTCRTLPRPWELTIRHLPVDDPVAAQLLTHLRWSLVAGDGISPTTRFTSDRTLRRYVSRNHHQQVRRLWNRINRDGISWELRHLRDATEIVPVLTEVEDVCRQRDRDMDRHSQLDDARHARFFREVISKHARAGEVLLTTLRFNGELAAYVVCFIDGGSYRMWNCRFAPRWRLYGLGRLANDAALSEALADPNSQEFDWMIGDEPYKSALTNDVVEDELLYAASSPVLLGAQGGRQHLRRLVKRRPELQRHVLTSQRGLQHLAAVRRSLAAYGRYDRSR